MYNSNSHIRPGQDKNFQFKLLIFVTIVILIFFILIIRIGYIQIIKNLSYSARSTKIREKTIRIPPIRGKIYSSDGLLLAHNINSFHIIVSPRELHEDNSLRQQELLFLAKTCQLNYQEIEKLIESNKLQKEVIIAENINLNQFVRILENIDNLPGVSYKEVLYREYPFHDTLSHILGYTGPINRNELAVYEKEGYLKLDVIGKNGIEKYYEKDLRGKAGFKVFSIDAKMTIQNEIKDKEVPPEPGKELILTIDMELQKNIEEILADRIGAILVMKPSSGEVLALASYPDYDPNIYILSNEISAKKRREIILNTKETPLINRNIQAIYPPASIFKLVSSTAIINQNLLSPQQSYYCGGILQVGIEQKKCWVYPNGHLWQTHEDAIVNSCDIYYYNVAKKIGPKVIEDYAMKYGFNENLNIDLPYEKSGFLPSPEKLKIMGKGWYDGDTMNMIIGQGEVKVTPLQIANFMSVICNKGYSYRPHILKEIRSSYSQETIKNIPLEKMTVINDVSMETFNFIHQALRKVVTQGTAKAAFYYNPFKISGKTGTSEVGVVSASQEKQTHSWFAGFGPVDYDIKDQIVVVTLIEYENGDYLRYAAPIAGMVFNAYYNKESFNESAKRLYYPVRDTYRTEE